MSLTTQSAVRSSHGSASPYDLHAILVARGPGFQERFNTTLPSGAVDLLPTLLTLLDIPTNLAFDGRVLQEALCQPSSDPGQSLDEIVYPQNERGAGESHLHLHRVGTTTYLHGAFRQDSPAYIPG